MGPTTLYDCCVRGAYPAVVLLPFGLPSGRGVFRNIAYLVSRIKLVPVYTLCTLAPRRAPYQARELHLIESL